MTTSWAQRIVTLLEARVPSSARRVKELLGGYAGTSARLAELVNSGKLQKIKAADGNYVYTTPGVSNIPPTADFAPVKPVVKTRRKKLEAAPELCAVSPSLKEYKKTTEKLCSKTSWFIVKTQRGPFSDAPTAYRNESKANRIAKAIGGQVITAIEKETA